MFGFFKKKDTPFRVAAYVDGKCIAITDVLDDVFSKKMMGDGFAIIPENDVIVSPIDGEIVTIFPTKHAIGLQSANGVEIILHIGIDTVNLNGEGFQVLVKDKAKVKIGQPIVKIDKDFIKEKGYDLTTMLVFTNGYDKEINLSYFNEDVKAGQVLIQ